MSGPQESGIATTAILQATAFLVAALYAVPMGYTIVVALTPNGEAIGAWPSHFDLGNFVDAYLSANFLRFLVNSAVVSVGCTILQILLSCSAGYALAMLPVRGRNLMLLLLIALLGCTARGFHRPAVRDGLPHSARRRQRHLR